MTFAAGSSTVTLDVVPIDDDNPEPDRSVNLSIQSGYCTSSGSGTGAYYNVSQSSASVMILNKGSNQCDFSGNPAVGVSAGQDAQEGQQLGYSPSPAPTVRGAYRSRTVATAVAAATLPSTARTTVSLSGWYADVCSRRDDPDPHVVAMDDDNPGPDKSLTLSITGVYGDSWDISQSSPRR